MTKSKHPIDRYVHEVRATTQEYARDLLGEYEKLLSLTLSLKEEKAHLEGQVMHLREELRSRAKAHADLAEQLVQIEASDRVFCSRYVEVEQLSSNLANLYVASYRIHASLERDQVLSAIQEVIVNLLGSEDFAIFERESGRDGLHLAASVGVDPGSDLHADIIERALASGTIYVRAAMDAASPDGPVVCIPLKVDDRVTGVIAIYSFLSHKDQVEPLDHELYTLLATHAATALFSSGLYARAKAQGLTP